MKTNTRYIVTAAGVAVGLFAIGATANALTPNDTATSEPIGTGVVLPVAADPSPSSSPSVVEVEYAEAAQPSPTNEPTGVPYTGSWTTGSGTAVGDDDHESDHESDDHEGDHESDD